MYATVMNYGGPAKMARYLVLEGDTVCMGNLPPSAYIASGEQRRMLLGAKAQTTKALAIVTGVDLANRRVHARSAAGESRTWRLERPWWKPSRLHRTISLDYIFRKMYPEAPENILDLKQAVGQLVEFTTVSVTTVKPDADGDS